MNMKIKTFSDTYIYNKSADSEGSMGKDIINFIRTSDRININSSAFEQIKNQVKVRQGNAITYKILLNKDVILCVNPQKEAPASFKVFKAKDLLSPKKESKVFIDCTGLFKLDSNSGMFICKEIDKFCAYLMMALVNFLYYDHNTNLIEDSTISKASTICFIKLFSAVMDNLRVTNFGENRIKIAYICGVYYLFSVMGKSMDSARAYAANAVGINTKDASGYDYWYTIEDLANIETFINFLSKTFKLTDLNSSIYLVRYMQMYGKGTIFGLELLPSFLSILTNADSGTFINQQKTILKLCGRDIVTVSNEITKLGNDFYSGFSYSNDQNKAYYDSMIK